MPAKRKVTPALKQYLELKEKYKDAILMFRMGDFYEMFFEDAEVASRELEIALTRRSFGKGGDKAPMCGVPYHAVEGYIAKLVRKGYKVAICEQLEEPKPGKKVVKRGVVRVITPGTYFEDETEDRFLMAVYPKGELLSVAWAEISSGDTFFSTLTKEELQSLIVKFKPKEVIVPKKFDTSVLIEIYPDLVINEKEEEFFEESLKTVETNVKEELKVLGALNNFIRETQIEFIPKLKSPRRYTGEKFIYFDPHTQRNLELVEPLYDKLSSATLFNVLNRTETGMGRRLLKFWILHPLKDRREIERRLDAVEELTKSFFLADELKSELKKVYDVERLLTKITSGIATPKDVSALRNSLRVFPNIKKLISEFGTELLSEISENFDDLYDVYCEIDRVLVDNPPFTSREGGLIRKGVNEELDKLRDIKENSERILKEIEERERRRTGIQSLKIGFNNVFGYYIEVSKANLHLVPKDYIRKQTLVNAERFITPELKEFEEKILSAQERIEKIEYEIFTELRRFITENSHRISKSAEQIAVLDVLLSLSKVAQERNYVKPEVTDGFEIEINEGRHPVLEKLLEDEFIPNDSRLNREERVLIITGPNMGGKSVFLRQTALITAMAQMGSFVPARRARIGIVDRIFTRVGAADNLSKGLSTFMMEMVETANILKNATERSLVILDEIGRGTSTYDGMSIARSVVEYLANEIGAKTLFATHYHELTELEGEIPQVKNYHVEVAEVDGKIVFTHRLVPGPSEKSYGIHVAEIAGLPKEVVERAKEILSELENSEPKVNYELPLFKVAEERKVNYGEKEISPELKRLVEELLKIEISTTTPLEALMVLSRLKELAKTVDIKG